MIYLDHNATTPVLPQVLEAMLPWFTDRFANPSSNHPDARLARQAINDARADVAALIGASPSEILFTSGGTESNNLALQGTAQASAITISAIEHPAIRQPAQVLAQMGTRIDVIPVGSTGRVDASATIRADSTLTSVMLANNETGVIQPIRALAEQTHAHGGLMHTDAAHAVGKIPVDVDELAVDLLTIAGHKLYGPKGIGALYVRTGTPIRPILAGADHERGLRPGTENTPGIVGLGAACRIAFADMQTESRRVIALRDRLWHQLRAIGAVRTGTAPWLPNTLHVCFPEHTGNALLAACPDLAASTGSACDAQGDHPSPVLLAMGSPHPRGALRLSLGRSTTVIQVDQVVHSLGTALSR